MSAFTGTLATRIVQLKPCDPESKGIVERRYSFFETWFMPGRTFTAPTDLIERDRASMLPLPPIPLQLGWRHRIRLGKDCYVRLDSSDYSVGPTMIGRLVDVTAALERVKVQAGGRIDRAFGPGDGAS